MRLPGLFALALLAIPAPAAAQTDRRAPCAPRSR